MSNSSFQKTQTNNKRLLNSFKSAFITSFYDFKQLYYNIIFFWTGKEKEYILSNKQAELLSTKVLPNKIDYKIKLIEQVKNNVLTEDTALEVVNFDGNLLIHTGTFRDNQKVVLAAIMNKGSALEFVSLRLRQDKTIIKAAIIQPGNHFINPFVPEQFKNDSEFMLECFKENYHCFYLFGEELREDVNFVLKCLDIHPGFINLIQNDSKNNIVSNKVHQLFKEKGYNKDSLHSYLSQKQQILVKEQEMVTQFIQKISKHQVADNLFKRKLL